MERRGIGQLLVSLLTGVVPVERFHLNVYVSDVARKKLKENRDAKQQDKARSSKRLQKVARHREAVQTAIDTVQTAVQRAQSQAEESQASFLRRSRHTFLADLEEFERAADNPGESSGDATAPGHERLGFAGLDELAALEAAADNTPATGSPAGKEPDLVDEPELGTRHETLLKQHRIV